MIVALTAVVSGVRPAETSLLISYEWEVCVMLGAMFGNILKYVSLNL